MPIRKQDACSAVVQHPDRHGKDNQLEVFS